VECHSHSGFGHSEDRDWKKHNKGKSRFGATNFLMMSPNDGIEAATVANNTSSQQPAAELAEATDGIDVVMEDVLKMAEITIGKELGPEFGAKNKELTDSTEDRISTSLVEVTAVIEDDTNIVSEEPPIDRLELSEEQAFAELHEEAGDEAASVIPKQEPVVVELAKEGTDMIEEEF
jgi:hypothetical protein